MGPRICLERIDNDDAKDSFKFMLVEQNVGRNAQAKTTNPWPILNYPVDNAKSKNAIVQQIVNARINQPFINPNASMPSHLKQMPLPNVAPVIHNQYKSKEHERYDKLVADMQLSKTPQIQVLLDSVAKSLNTTPLDKEHINKQLNYVENEISQQKQSGSAGQPKLVKTSENAWFLFEKRKHMRIVYKGAYGAKFVKFAGKWERLSHFTKRIV